MKLEWTRSHADQSPWETINDLVLQRLSRDEIFNVWCDRLSEQAWKQGPWGFLTQNMNKPVIILLPNTLYQRPSLIGSIPVRFDVILNL